MSARAAYILVADDLLYSVSGKMFLQGIYIGDIAILPGSSATQLAFLLTAETNADEPFEFLNAEITLPSGELITSSVDLSNANPIPGRSKMSVRWAAFARTPVLQPGRILCRVQHEKGYIEVAAPWLVSAETG